MVISGKLIPKYIVGLVVVLVAVCVFIPLVLMPYLNTKDELKTKTAKNNEQIALYDRTLVNYDELQAKVEELKKEWETMEDELFIKDEFIINDLSDMMNEVGIIPESIVVSDEAEVMPGEQSSTGDALYSITISMKFTDDPETLLEYINYIEEESEGVYLISDVKCTTVGKATGENVKKTVGEGDLVTDMAFTAYYFKDVPTSITTEPTTTEAA